MNLKLETLMARTERTNKIRSIKDVKSELGSFFSTGYSRLLNTKSVFKKLFCLLCMGTLTLACVVYANKNYQDYSRFNVVTQIKTKVNNTWTFPAISFCLQTLNYSLDSNGYPYNRVITPQNLSDDNLKLCTYEENMACNLSHFEYFQVYNAFYDDYFNCHKFNGGQELLTATRFGVYTGLVIEFNLSDRHLLSYYIGDNKVMPDYKEIRDIVQPGKNVFVHIRQIVDEKLPDPYSPCTADISARSSYLVEQIILETNVSYRQTNCFDLCLREYASARNIYRYDAYKMKFDYEAECGHLCPLECLSHTFEDDAIEVVFADSAHVLWMNFFYSDNKQLEITQTVKTTTADLVSNTGGVLGLFLELSFISVYQFFSNVIDVLFF